MKILFTYALILVFGLIGYGQTKREASPEKLLVISAFPPVKNGENAEAVKIRNRGIDLAIKGEHELSLAEFNKAIELDPNFADAYNRRGAAFSNLKDNNRAIADFTKAIELQPAFDIPYMNRAIIYMLEKNYKSAVLDFTDLVKLQPEMAIWYSFRADAYDKLGNKKLAFADLRKARELRKKS